MVGLGGPQGPMGPVTLRVLKAEFLLCSNEHPATMVEKSVLNSAPRDKLAAVVVDPTMIL